MKNSSEVLLMKFKKKYENKTQMLYSVIRVVMLLSFGINILGFIIGDDDSQKSRDMFNAIQVLLMFLCTYVPGFIERTGKVSVPNVMSITFLCFCIAHFIVGEVGGVYATSKVFDSVLHTLSGSMLAILGFSIIRLLINYDKKNIKLNPMLVSVFVVCFSVTVGVAWEVVEFFADAITGSNMQRYSDSVTREDFFGRKALFDTMKDLILDAIGAITVAIISYIDLKSKKSNPSIKWFIEKKKDLPYPINNDLKVLNLSPEEMVHHKVYDNKDNCGSM